MPYVVSTATALPPYCYPQPELAKTLKKFCMANEYAVDATLIDGVFKNSTIEQRYFALPLDGFYEPPPMHVVNGKAFAAAVDLTEQAVRAALAAVELPAEQVHRITSVMSTVIGLPTLDAHLMNRLGFAPHTKRVPVNGLGCMGGAAGFGRVADYLFGHPREAVVLVACELGGTTFWSGGIQGFLAYAAKHAHEDSSLYGAVIAQIISSALFGDAAAALVMVGDEHPLAGRGPRVLGTRSETIPSSIEIMGVQILAQGFINTLSAEVPDYAGRAVKRGLGALALEHGIDVARVEHWLLHPGGPKVLDGVEEALGLPPAAMAPSRATMARIGNVSAPTVLVTLDEAMQAPPARGTHGALAGMGPGFSVELALLQW